MHNPKWDKYREKPCPVCQKVHKKRGLYCGQACANRARPQYSDKVREAARRIGKESAAAPHGLAVQAMFAKGIKPPPAQDFAIEIPQFYDVPDGYTAAEDW